MYINSSYNEMITVLSLRNKLGQDVYYIVYCFLVIPKRKLHLLAGISNVPIEC